MIAAPQARDIDKLYPEQVEVEVRRFWTVFMDRNAEALMDFYSAESSVFSSVNARSEPGRLAAARRQREYFHKNAAIRATTGAVEVVMLSDHSAIASYTFQFHAARIEGADKHTAEEDIKNGRATQIFILDHDGKIRIVHEHLSSLEKAH
jgi:ketosteroid isomerase-like protein